MRLYERARDLIVSDPDIMGGTPVIRGTRITAQAMLGRINADDSIASILEPKNGSWLIAVLPRIAGFWRHGDKPTGHHCSPTG